VNTPLLGWFQALWFINNEKVEMLLRLIKRAEK